MTTKRLTRRKRKQKFVWITVEISKENHRKLKAIAKERKISVSKLCREIITEYLDTMSAEKSF
jgi:predicted HicB family RNase H-like nuclease